MKDVPTYSPPTKVDDVLFNISHQMVGGDVENHAHNECIEITLIFAGKALHHADGRSVIFQKGDVGVTLLGGIHGMSKCTGIELFTVSCSGKPEAMTGFNLNLLSGMRELFSGSKVTRIFHLNSIEFADVYRVMKYLEQLHCSGGHTDPYRGELRSGFAILLCLLARAYARSMPQEAGLSRMERALNYINEHFTEQLDLKYLSHLSALSVSQFIRRFKSSYGSTPINYQLELRFNEASRLLRESNLSISEISYWSGFESSAYFATAFKRKYAMSPREYRKIENAGNKKPHAGKVAQGVK